MTTYRILVVEDQQIVAMDIQNSLRKLGFTVPAVVSSGEEAIEQATKIHPDLVLMDIKLKGEMDGIEAAEQIRTHCRIPVVYLTAYADANTVNRAKVTEPYGYIIKPFEELELYTTIETALYKHRTERELKESREWLATTLKSISDAVIATDGNGRVTFMNPVAEALTGWKQEEVQGEDLAVPFRIVDEKTRTTPENPVTKVLRKGTVVGLGNHTLLIARDGREIPIDDGAAPIRDEHGHLIGVVLVFRDVTVPRRAEEALRYSEEHFRSLIENISDIITILDAEGTILYQSPSIERVIGYSTEELLGKNVFALMHPDYISQSRDWFADLIREPEVARALELVFPHKDGSWKVFETVGKRLPGNTSRTSVVLTSRNITERKQTEEFIRNILGSIDEGFMVVDSNYRIVSANKAYCNQVKMPLENVIGRHCYELSHHIAKPCHENGEECPVNQTFETGDPHTVSHRHYDQKGNPLYVEIKSYPMKDTSGKTASAIEIIRDITEKKKLEDQLRHAQKMEAVGHLAGGISHDFNNILTAITGYGSLLLMKMDPDDPSRTYVEQILASSERAANLTQSLLTFSRKQIIDLKIVRLNEIIKRVEKLLRRVMGEDIELHTRLAEENFPILVDSSQIDQVLINLATNARDAMPMGGVFTISTERTEIDPEYIKAYGYGKLGPFALITVSDTGEGMNEEIKERIFEPFFTTKEVGKGTGLGLAIVYGIVKQHNGYINAWSEPGKGSTFRIYFPIARAEVQEIEPKIPAPLIGGTETVLLAEDDISVRRLTKEVLEGFGYRVVEAVDGEDAIRKFKENSDRIQLLLFDIIMPKKNGRETCAEIKKLKPDVKAIFVSGYATDIIQQRGIDEEGLNLLLKPVLPNKLLRRVREVLDNGEG